MDIFASEDDPNLKIYTQTFGLYQCIDDTFLLTQCIPLIVYLIAAILIEFFLGKCIYESYKYKGKLWKKKNIILGCLFLGNLAYIVFNCSRGQQYIYFFQNFFMSMQLALIIYYFASKAFKLIENENVKVFVKAMFGIIIVYNFGILILNFVEYYVSKQGKVCKYPNCINSQVTFPYYQIIKANTWTYIRAIEFFFSLIFAGVGKYVINRMEEQIKRIGIPQHTADTIDTQNIPAPLLENIHQYNNKIAQKKKIWILIIVNLIAGITVNIKNFFILYNGRNDCRYIGHGDDDYSNGRDVGDTILVFLTKVFSYYLPIIVSIFVFRLTADEMKVFEKEYYYEEGVYTTALGMKARRGNSEEWDENSLRQNRQKKESEYNQSSINEATSKKSSQQISRNKVTSSDMHQTKSINAISPCSGDL